MSNRNWTPESWVNHPAKQLIRYANDDLRPVLNQLQSLPALVSPGEIRRLRQKLALACESQAFVLQGGDCAERFIDCNETSILSKFKILLQMSVILSYGLRLPVIRIGRMAGQYGKPRSSPFEDTPQGKLHSYFGDNINAFEPDPVLRQPDAKRLLEGYFHSAATLNHLRALIAGGFADLHYPQTWRLDTIRSNHETSRYDDVSARILDAIAFMESFGGLHAEKLGGVDFFTSHEGLHLPFEQAMTRYANVSGEQQSYYFSTSAHFLWIGERTRNIDGAHVEFFRGIENPIGIKVGPSADAQEIADLCRILNPANEKGKIVLITRLGSKKTVEILPTLVQTITDRQLPVLWMSDPMHGNGITVQQDNQQRKTRSFDAILDELTATRSVLHSFGKKLGGVHFELTGEDVTECIGGTSGITELDLGQRYESFCDPRLNYAQSLEMAFKLSEN